MDLFATVTCIVALFAELGGCIPELNHNRRSLSSTSPDRNIVDLFCSEDGSETMATFLNGSTQLNLIPSATHTHTLTPETEAGIVCRNEEGVQSNEIRLAALPFDMEVQDDPPRVQCVCRGEEVELPCEYPPGNLRELYSVQWRFRMNGSTVLVPPGFGPNGSPLPSGSLLSIDEDTFALTVAVDQLEQTGDQFHCDVNVRRNNIGTQQQTTVRYIGAIVELKVKEPVEIVDEVQDSRVDIGEPASFTCVATGTDVTISWEIEGQNYTNCSNTSICVRATESDSMVNSTIAVNASLANNTRVQCTASQMCGTASSSGRLSLVQPHMGPNNQSTESMLPTAAIIAIGAGIPLCFGVISVLKYWMEKRGGQHHPVPNPAPPQPRGTEDSHTEEYRKLEGKKDVLVDAIADAKCIPSLAMELHSMGMIPKSVYTKANTHALEVTDLTHAQVIIDAMLPEVDRPHPEGRDNYDKLLRALHKNDSDLAKILDDD